MSSGAGGEPVEVPVRAGRRETDRFFGPTPGAVEAINRLDHRLRRRYIPLAIGLALISLWVTFQQLSTSHTAHEANHTARQTSQLVHRVAELTEQNHRLAVRIQQQRYDTALANCVDQDRRHDATKRRLGRGFVAAFRQQAHSPALLRQTREQYSFTVGLIDALAPRTEDCRAKARAVVSGG